MFLIRSAFWLTAAYLLIAPASDNIASKAEAAGSDIMRGGQSLLIAGLEKAPACESFECTAGRAVLSSVVIPSVPVPAADPATPAPLAEPAVTFMAETASAPIPPRRPDWAG